MNYRGVTLIELLIVVTIIAILSGAAIPYVQQYVDDARISKAKSDLDEIRNGLVRFEVERGVDYTQTTIASLVGPFINKALIDPWGAGYKVRTASSSCFSTGSDGQEGGGDDIILEYRPRMAIAKLYWMDKDQGAGVNVGDSVEFRLTRPVKTGSTPTNAGLTLSSGGVTFGGAVFPNANNRKVFELPISAITTGFSAGSDTIAISDTNDIIDGNNVKANSDVLKILAK